MLYTIINYFFWGKDVNEHEIYKWDFLNIELYLLSGMNFN